MKYGTAAAVFAGLHALAVVAATSAHAGQLVYTPVNPNFGGSPLNGSFLLNQAAQDNGGHFLTNPLTAKAANSTTTAQQQVIENLQQAAVNAVLSEVAQQISNGLQNNVSGSYNVAGELINFQRVGNEINIQLTDATTGAQTTIQIPVPTF
jgi:curli production assembly/transport component CsgF